MIVDQDYQKYVLDSWRAEGDMPVMGPEYRQLCDMFHYAKVLDGIEKPRQWLEERAKSLRLELVVDRGRARLFYDNALCFASMTGQDDICRLIELIA